MANKQNVKPGKGTTPQEPKQEGTQKGDDMLFDWSNYKWMLVGVALLVVGFVLMAGGGSDNPEVFNYEEIFSWRRIGLAPIVVLSGFGVVGYAIMKKRKK